MSNRCVRDQLLGVIDDIELVAKELFETMLTPKLQRSQWGYKFDHSQLAAMLVSKDKELKACLKLAAEQEDIQRQIDSLKLDVEKQDDEIKQMQKHLKEAEHMLATAIYQAKQKLAIISKANEHQIQSEELIKYSHKISSSHAVAAPYNWEQGDPRRPYPTDIEMRLGLLGQMGDLPLNSTLLQQQQQQQQQQQNAFNAQTDLTRQTGTSFGWQADIKPNISTLHASLHPPGFDVKSTSKDDVEDVEVMSTDSSSSSSSDSQ